MSAMYWLIIMLVLIVIEIATLGLTTIWFAGGCLAAFVTSVTGGSPVLQVMVFFIVSLILLFATRPIAVRYLNKGRTRTNVDSLIGQRAVVTKTIDNLKAEGEAEVNGQTWSARAAEEDHRIEAGTVVEICRISGVKLIVKEKMEDEAWDSLSEYFGRCYFTDPGILYPDRTAGAGTGRGTSGRISGHLVCWCALQGAVH